MLTGSLGDMLVWKILLVERHMSFGSEGSGFEYSSAPLSREIM